MEPLLSHRQDPSLKFFAYADVARPDEMTSRLQTLVDEWRLTFGTSDQALRQQIGADGIDIMVDLSGHTSGARTTLLCSRVAFVQINYLGYPGTTGLPSMDFRIVDELTDPDGAPAGYSEALLYMPHGFLCFRPVRFGNGGGPLSDTTRPFTFGCFNNVAKISDTCLRLWARILRTAPHSHLALKATAFADTGIVSGLRKRAQEHGVPGERLHCWPPLGSYAEHIAAYGEVDVALDTFPYHGTTTTCEALAAGVPVVSLIGSEHVSRVGLTLLTRVDLQECATTSEDHYVGMAVALSSDGAKLAHARQRLSAAWPRSELTNGRQQAQAFEGVLRQSWQQKLRPL